MPTYRYVAVDAAGKQITGVLRADSPERVEQRLYSLNLYPVRITEQKARGPALFQPRIPERLLIDFTSGLATVVGSGVPLVQGLKAIADQLGHPGIRRVVEGLVNSVSAGERLSVAMASFPRTFPTFYVKVVEAGERGGHLEYVLNDLAELMEAQAEIRAKVREALMYPAFVLTVLAGLVFIFLSFVLPRLMSVIQEIGMPLPTLTRFVMAIAFFFQHNWWRILLGLVILVVGVRYLGRFPRFRRLFDRWKLALPVVGKVIWMIAVARFSRFLALFHRAGLLITESLELCSQMVGNRIIGDQILELREMITEGARLSRALEATPFVPPMMVLMTRVGEESGELEKSLLHVADYYDRESARAIRRALTLLEPTVIIMVAFVVGLTLASAILPIYSIYNYIR